jgi:hypothetical protein
MLIVEDLHHNRQIRTAEELGRMIAEDLSKVDGCPKRGVNLTI